MELGEDKISAAMEKTGLSREAVLAYAASKQAPPKPMIHEDKISAAMAKTGLSREAVLAYAASKQATPALAAPETATPALAAPETATSALAAPETATSALAVPETATSALAVPETATPALAAPETAKAQENDRLRAQGFSSHAIALSQTGGDLIDYDGIDPETFATPDTEVKGAKFDITGFGYEQLTASDSFAGFMDAFMASSATLEKQAIVAKAKELQVDPRTKAGINAVYYAQSLSNQQADLQTRVAEMEVATDYHDMFQDVGQYASDWIEAAVHERSTTNRTLIAETLNKEGYDITVEGEDYYYTDAEGTSRKVTPSWWDQVEADKFGTVLGLAGGAKIAKIAFKSSLPIVGQLSLATGGFGAASAAGAQVDYALALRSTQMEADFKLGALKAYGAFTYGILGGVIGGALRGLVASGRLTKEAYAKFGDLLSQRKSRLAVEALAELHPMTRVEMRDKMHFVEAELGFSLKGSENDKIVQALPMLTSGGAELVADADKLNKGLASRMASIVKNRSQHIKTLAQSLERGVTGDVLQEGLKTYTSRVGKFFEDTKSAGGFLAPSTYTFSPQELAIRASRTARASDVQAADWVAPERLLDIHGDEIVVPTSQSAMAQIRATAELLNSVPRINNGFAGLLKLRQELNANAFQDNGGMKALGATYKQVIAVIDREIEDVVTQTPHMKEWGKTWNLAKEEYGGMRDLVKESVSLTLAKGNLNNEEVVKLLRDNSENLNDVYRKVVSTIPPKQLAEVESSLIRQAIEDSMKGSHGEVIDFRVLERTLDFKPRTAVGVRMKRMLTLLGNNLRSDAKMVKAAGKVSVTGTSESILSTTITGWLKRKAVVAFALSASRFDPSSNTKYMLLAERFGELMKNPLDAQLSKTVYGRLKDSPEILEHVKAVQVAAAREAAKADTNTVTLMVGRNGQSTVVRSTPANRATVNRAGLETYEATEVLTADAFKVRFRSGSVVISPAVSAVLKADGFKVVLDSTGKAHKL